MKIAIIGSGISGLGAAYLLNTRHDITLFEKNPAVGGHSRTIDVTTPAGKLAVDTGFIVFNHRNYPLLTGLFSHLGVPTQKSDMSFGASIANGDIEYGSKGMFSQKKNLLRPAFYGMIADILRFNRQAESYADSNLSLGELLDKMSMGRWFRQYYLQAMGAAIWSCSVETILRFPAATFIRFFKNHGLLTVNDHPQWHTVTGGSRTYVQKITAGFMPKIRADLAIKSVRRHSDHVILTDKHDQKHYFDQVVFAGHADDTLLMIENPTDAEKSVLGSFTFQENKVVAHCDQSFMPKTRGAWASWVYLAEKAVDEKPVVSLSYWMNNLQGLPASAPVFVTLNPGRMPDASLTYDTHYFKHPVFTHDAIRAQQRLDEIQGKERSFFCGAWQRYGFHEDGLLSAVTVARKFGVEIPWK